MLSLLQTYFNIVSWDPNCDVGSSGSAKAISTNLRKQENYYN